MMNAGKISPKDYRWLMAYLDDTLSQKDRVRFEDKLENYAELKQALLQQKRLKAALRSLPVKNAPRDYMLTPDMVSVRKTASPMFPIFRFASVAATIMLVFVFAGQYLLGPLLSTARQASPKEAMLIESEVDLNAVEEAPEQEPLIIWGDQSGETYGMGGAVGMGGGIDPLSAAEAEKLMGEEQLVESVEMPITEEAEPEVQMQAVPLEQPTAGESNMLVDEPEGELAAPLILGVNTEEGGEIIAQSAPAEELTRTRNLLAPLNWIEIALGVVAIGASIAALFMRRRA